MVEKICTLVTDCHTNLKGLLGNKYERFIQETSLGPTTTSMANLETKTELVLMNYT